jgi:hypothetical protein
VTSFHSINNFLYANHSSLKNISKVSFQIPAAVTTTTGTPFFIKNLNSSFTQFLKFIRGDFAAFKI